MFGRVNVWQIAESKLVDKKVWQMVTDRLSHKDNTLSVKLDSFIWQVKVDLHNSPNYPDAKHSHCTV